MGVDIASIIATKSLYLVAGQTVGACAQIVQFTEVLGLLLLSPGWLDGGQKFRVDGLYVLILGGLYFVLVLYR